MKISFLIHTNVVVGGSLANIDAATPVPFQAERLGHLNDRINFTIIYTHMYRPWNMLVENIVYFYEAL